MRSTTRRGCLWTRRITCLSIGGLLFLGGYLTALWAPLPMAATDRASAGCREPQRARAEGPARSQDARGRPGAFHDS